MSSSVGNSAVVAAETVLAEGFFAAFLAGDFFAALTEGRRVFGAETSAVDVALADASTSLLGVFVFRGTLMGICVSD